MLFALKSFQNVRYFTKTVPLFAQNHYDVLGIGVKAIQADVKAAYYKLSMVYHPDKNKGCENSATKFRNIAAAYEVLGNIQLRKLYDRGISHISGGKVAPEHPMGNFHKSREYRSRRIQFYRAVADKKNSELKFAQFITLFGMLLGSFYSLICEKFDHDRVTFAINDTIIIPKNPGT